MKPISDTSTTSCNAPSSDFPEVQGKASVMGFFLGMAVIVATIFLGRSTVFIFSFLAFSFLLTLLWRNDPRSWISLVSVSAAIPIAVSRYQFAGNLIFAFWFAVFNMRDLFRLPGWMYVPAALAILGILTSSINWMSGDVLRDIMRETTHAFNFFLAPFLLLPMVYLRMRESSDRDANLQGLLFCLIIPSTLILISAKVFGTVTNEWEASLHVESLSEGFLMYKLGNVFVNFLRTEVGFILAALICASTAVAVTPVKGLYRLIAGACLASNVFLLLATGSFGSIFACLCGLAAILFFQFRTFGMAKLLVSLAVVCCMLLLVYSFSPPGVKEYLGKRFEHRVVQADRDRLWLWSRAVEHLFQHPGGVGLTLAVGDAEKTIIHNDYLTYAVSYGLIGGFAYMFLVVKLLVYFLQVRRGAIGNPYMLAVHLAGLGVLVAIAVNSMTDHMNSNRWYFNVIWSLIWYCYFCSDAARAAAFSEGMHRENVVSSTAESQQKSLQAVDP